jgi:hypothetical protein
MARARHPNKEIEAAVRHAEDLGWRVSVGGSHAWGFLYCPEESREGCRWAVHSTPRNPEGHARYLRRKIDDCPHAKEEEE